MTTKLETRQIEFRAELDPETREISGIGVPYGEIINVYGQREMFAPGSVRAEKAKLFDRHREAIGGVRYAVDDKTGWHPTAFFSKTTRGEDAYTLCKDGVYDGLSVGFEPVRWHMERDDEGEYIVYEEALVREVSVCPFPFYPSARIKSVRSDEITEDPANSRKEPAMTTTETQEREGDLRELREGLDLVQRQIVTLNDRGLNATAPEADTRTAGEWLRALATGDADTVRAYEDLVERAYDGGTSDDGLLTPQYVGDTIRLFEAPDPLSQIFSTGRLPEKGLKLEYGVLESDTVKVEIQENEGDNLAKGSISVGVKHADIKTYGGHVELTRQQIERTTNVNMLDLHLRGLALRGARRKAQVLRADYWETRAANAAIPEKTIVIPDFDDHLAWIGGIVDGAEAFIDLGLPLEGLVVDKTLFMHLAGLGTTTRPLMQVSGQGASKVGTISAKTLGGDLADVRVHVNLKQQAPGASFVNGEAIRQYASAVTELADENIVNLSKQFGMYYYAANAVEIPDAIIPIVTETP